MNYYFKPSALRDLKKLPKNVSKRILDKLDFYLKQENPLKFAKPIKDKSLGDYRFRIGDYRAIFDYDSKQNIIIILKIGHRKNIYK